MRFRSLPVRVSAHNPPLISPLALQRFMRFIAERQTDNGGQPAILLPADIERVTGISQSEQIRIRQNLMLAGRLRLSVEADRWAYDVMESV